MIETVLTNKTFQGRGGFFPIENRESIHSFLNPTNTSSTKCFFYLSQLKTLSKFPIGFAVNMIPEVFSREICSFCQYSRHTSTTPTFCLERDNCSFIWHRKAP